MTAKKTFEPRWWTAEEIELIRKLAANTAPEKIAEQLDGRSVNAVKLKIYNLGLRTVTGSVFWTAEEDAVLRSAPKGTSVKALAAELGRSLQAVYMRQGAIGARVGVKSKWSAEEDAQLRKLAWTMSWADLAAQFEGRTEFGLKARVSLLKLGHKRFWTAEEDAVIVAGGSAATMREMVEKLGRSYNSVWNRRRALGVAPGTKRKWMAREVEQLREGAGRLPVLTLARQLGRTPRSVVHKAEELGLDIPRKVGRPCVSLERRQRVARPKLVPVTVAQVAYCPVCHAPVCNTVQGWAGHNQRMGCNRKARI